MTTPMKDSEVIAKAQDLVRDPENWYRGYWCNKDNTDQLCVMGAIGVAMGKYVPEYDAWTHNPHHGSSQYGRILTQLSVTAYELFPNPDNVYDIIHYNDDRLSHQDLMVVLDKARIKAEEHGQ